LWDDALFGVSSSTTGVTEEATRADTITDREALKNAVANFEQYTECRAQLNALIDFHEQDK
jgi:hypothetical protein